MAANPGDPITPVIDRLTAIIANAEAQASRTGYFAGLYRRVTIAVRDQIESFDDPGPTSCWPPPTASSARRRRRACRR